MQTVGVGCALAGLALWKLRASQAAETAASDVLTHFKLVSGTLHLPDVQHFLHHIDLNYLGHQCSTPDVFLGRAPGRLDVMGGIADYSGSLVLQLPIAEACMVALRKNDSAIYRVRSPASDTTFEMPVSELSAVETYQQALSLFTQRNGGDWAAYVLGCFVVLAFECGHSFCEGCNIQVHSDVPMSMGVSSSAAVEVSTMQAIAGAFDVQVDEFLKDSEYSRGTKVAMLCQKVENLVVGAPCGIMDQMASNLGHKNKLLALLCRPAHVEGLVDIPEGLEFWGLDSGHKHAVGGHAAEGADYGSVRVGAFMGKAILNSEQRSIQVAHTTEWSPSDYEWAAQMGSVQLPEQMSGQQFVDQFGTHGDSVTTIEPTREYAIRIPTEHAIYEHHRVQLFTQLLSGGVTERLLGLLGDMMRSSHLSYSRCGLGSTSTDLLVELARESGRQNGIYGAKITGGGSGGTVVVLAKAGGEAAVKAVAAKYAMRTGHMPHIFRSSSMGGEAFGCASLHVR